jgi:hypothetical protein
MTPAPFPPRVADRSKAVLDRPGHFSHDLYGALSWIQATHKYELREPKQ